MTPATREWIGFEVTTTSSADAVAGNAPKTARVRTAADARRTVARVVATSAAAMREAAGERSATECRKRNSIRSALWLSFHM